jgi:transcriptional regulator with XRE-family HTH domain
MFSIRLAQLIRERGWTQLQAAQRLGISQTLISFYLSGKREPLPRTISHIAERLDVSITELIGEKGGKGRRMPSLLKAMSSRESHVDLPNEAAMKNLKVRWKKHPGERDTIKHLIAALFPRESHQILAWLER